MTVKRFAQFHFLSFFSLALQLQQIGFELDALRSLVFYALHVTDNKVEPELFLYIFLFERKIYEKFIIFFF